MPSGAKRRKAAKKKKEQGAQTIGISIPRGNDDVKSQDGKESDGSTPVSRDSDRHSFNEGNEELEERDSASIQSVVAQDKSMDRVPIDVEDTQEVEIEDGDVVKIERELKPEQNFEGKNGSIAHDESAKESQNGNDSNSSSSSSDEESRVTEKKPKEEAYKSVLDDLVEPVNSSMAEVIQVTEYEPVEKTINPVAETAPVVDSVKPVVFVSEETIHIKESAPVENPVIADVVESGLKEIEEKLLPKLNEAPAAVVDLASKKNEDKVFPVLDENVQASSTLMESVSIGYEGKILPSSSAPLAETSDGAASIKDSEIPESSEKQPLVAPAPRVVQRSSLFSCCGLFDVLAGR